MEHSKTAQWDLWQHMIWHLAEYQNKTVEILDPLQLYPELCVVFSFDSASILADSKGGVQAILKSTYIVTLTS